MRRTGTYLAAAVVACGVVAGLVVAASAARPATGGPSTVRWWPLVVAVVVAVVAVVVFVRAALQVRQVTTPEDRGDAARRRVASFVAGAIVVVVATLLRPDGDPAASAPWAGLGEAPQLPAGAPAAVARLTGTPSLVALVLFAGLVVVGAATVARRHATDGPATATEPGDDLGPVVRRVERDVRSEEDPRRAVLRAFAAFEAEFAARGLPRRDGETQAAWVERLLVEHGAPAEPARTLRERFEVARFATTPVTERDRRVALDALDALVGP